MGFANVINALRKNPKIIIGSIQGKAVGGGVGLAAAVDLCFASEYASIKLSELNIGIGPFVIEPALKRKLGLSVVSQLTLHPQTFFSAKWAREKGLYANVFESNEDLNKHVSSVANQLSTYNPEALTEFKKIQWEESNHWDDLLTNRAEISGRLVLSSFTKTQLKKFIKS
jgi:methylglutaconyl-CoA hydratase